MRVKFAGCPVIDAASLKEPKKLTGLKIDQPYWDLPCLECCQPMLRLLRVVSLVIHKRLASLRCKNCDSVHAVVMLRKGVKTFQLLVGRDYGDQTSIRVTPFSD
jgi:hypothetical protein